MEEPKKPITNPPTQASTEADTPASENAGAKGTKGDKEGTAKNDSAKAVKADAGSASKENEAVAASNSTAKAKPEAKHKHESKARSHKTRGGHGIPWVALIACIGVAGVAVWGEQNARRQASQLEELQQQLTQQLQSNAKQVQQLNGQLDQTRQELQQAQAALQSSEAKAARERLDLEEKIKQVQDLAAAKGKDPLKWRIAEVDYLLALANHRLILSRDPGTAKTALMDADKRLRSIADPGLSSIRQTLAAEIKSLESLSLPDIAGMAHELSALSHSIEQLPLVNRERVSSLAEVEDANGKTDSWEAVPGLIWEQIRGLISIRRHDQPIEPLLPPDEQQYLSQNLALKLEQARLALLRGDNDVFQSNLQDTQDWVAQYFDKEASAVQTVVKTIESMRAVQLNPALPDISGSLRELRRWVEINKQAANA